MGGHAASASGRSKRRTRCRAQKRAPGSRRPQKPRVRKESRPFLLSAIFAAYGNRPCKGRRGRERLPEQASAASLLKQEVSQPFLFFYGLLRRCSGFSLRGFRPALFERRFSLALRLIFSLIRLRGLLAGLHEKELDRTPIDNKEKRHDREPLPEEAPVAEHRLLDGRAVVRAKEFLSATARRNGVRGKGRERETVEDKRRNEERPLLLVAKARLFRNQKNDNRQQKRESRQKRIEE